MKDKGTKNFIKNKYPKVFLKSKKALISISNIKSDKVVFTSKYKNKDWGEKETVSGPGSAYEAVKHIKAELPGLVNRFKIKSILDAACGDFSWMKDCKLNIDSYTGVDVVKELIENNNKVYGSPATKFIEKDISKDLLPKSDLIFCRDCLVHLSFKKISKALQNFINSGSLYLLTTSFEDFTENEDIITGGWRPINPEKAPFNFPAPIFKIYERLDDVGKYYPDKILGLWKLSDLPLK